MYANQNILLLLIKITVPTTKIKDNQTFTHRIINKQIINKINWRSKIINVKEKIISKKSKIFIKTKKSSNKIIIIKISNLINIR
jgi:hypothetical protein